MRSTVKYNVARWTPSDTSSQRPTTFECSKLTMIAGKLSEQPPELKRQNWSEIESFLRAAANYKAMMTKEVQLKWIALVVWLTTILMLMQVWYARNLHDDRGNVGVTDCSDGMVDVEGDAERQGWSVEDPHLELVQLEAVFAGDFGFTLTIHYVLRILRGKY